jgi:hypothetical protein
MVIETNLAGWAVTRILIDTRSSADILFASTFDKMKLIEIFSNRQNVRYTD